MHVIIRLFVLALIVAVAASFAVAQAPPPGARSFLALSCDRGACYGIARYYETGVWTVTAYDREGDGRGDFVSLQFRDSATNENWWISFQSPAGRPLEPGFYGNASGVYDSDPKLYVSGHEYGCSQVKGSFTVLVADLEFVQGESRVRSFAASFEHHCDGNLGALHGVISYVAPPVPTVVSATYDHATGKLQVYGERLESTVDVVVDGVPFGAKVNRKGIVTVKGVALSAGVHTLAVRDGTGAVSPVFPVDFSLGLPGPPSTSSRLVMHTEGGPLPGDKDILGALWYPILGDADRDGKVDLVTFVVTDVANFNQNYEFRFGTTQLGPIEVRTYDDFSYHGELPGTADFSIRGPDGESYSLVEGFFTVDDLAIDYTQGFPTLVRMSVTYDFQVQSAELRRTGTVAYFTGPSPRLGRAQYDRQAKVLNVTGEFFTGSLTVVVDGRDSGTVNAASRSATVSGLNLRRGLHAISVRNEDGRTARPVLLRVP